jgi:hypothetical protein
MYEHESNRAGGARRELIDLLTSDFTSPEQAEYEREGRETGNALTSFLSHAIAMDEVDERLKSEENQDLGCRVVQALAGAPITSSFKLHIAQELQAAHAYRGTVDPVVSTAALGLDDGPGIYSTEHAQAIEARALQHFLGVVASTPPEQAGQLTNIALLGAWVAEFSQLYGEGAVIFAQDPPSPDSRPSFANP